MKIMLLCSAKLKAIMLRCVFAVKTVSKRNEKTLSILFHVALKTVTVNDPFTVILPTVQERISKCNGGKAVGRQDKDGTTYIRQSLIVLVAVTFD